MLQNLSIGTLTANYNGGKYFEECFAGILNQTRLPEWIIVIDDGSDYSDIDLIHGIIEKYGGKWSRLSEVKMDGSHLWYPRYFRLTGLSEHHIRIVILPQKENKGVSAARNVGINFALNNKINYLCIADIDDIFYPDKLKKSLEVIENYPQTGVIYSDYDTTDLRDGRTTREFKPIFSYDRLTQECIVSNNSLIRTELFKHIGGYDESLRGGEDYDLWLRIAEIAPIYHIPESLYNYRLTGGNATLNIPPEQFAKDVRRVHEKMMERQNGN